MFQIEQKDKQIAEMLETNNNPTPAYWSTDLSKMKHYFRNKTKLVATFIFKKMTMILPL